MPTVLFISDARSLEHAGRSLKIARALQQRFDGTIALAAHGQYTSLLADSGLPFYELEGPSAELQRDLGPNRFRVYDPRWVRECFRAFRRMIDSDLELFERLRPDLVVMDARFSTMISTEAFGVPCIRVVYGALVVTRRSVQSVVRSDVFASSFLPPALGWIPAAAVRPVAGRLTAIAMWILSRLLNRFRREYGLPPIGTLDDTPLRALILSDWPPLARPGDLPASARIVGPTLWEPELPIPEALRGERDLVYVWMGSTGDPQSYEIVRDCFRLLPQLRGAMAVGKLLDPEQLRPPPNLHVERFLPGLQILGQARLIVCHGGMGGIYQALSHGVPILGIPFHLTEPPAMARVEELGLGLTLERRDLTPETLAAAIRTILGEPRYTDAARAAQAEIRRLDGPVRAADVILAELGKPASGHDQPG